MKTQMTRQRMTRLYDDRQKWIKKVVAKFVYNYGGDYDEYLSEANYQFAKHAHTWRAHRGTFSKHISFRIWTGLLEARRRKIKECMRGPVSIEDVDQNATAVHTTKLVEFIDELPEDAKVIVQHVLVPCIDLTLLIAEREGIRVVHRALREFLHDWAPERLYQAFADIEHVLSPTEARQDIASWLDRKLFFK